MNRNNYINYIMEPNFKNLKYVKEHRLPEAIKQHHIKLYCSFMIIKFSEFFLYSGYQSFSRNVFCKNFTPVCGLHFYDPDRLLKFKILMKFDLSVFSFTNYAFGVMSKKSLLNS